MIPERDSIHPNPQLAEKLGQIYALHRKTIDFRLDGGPYIELLKKLGNPHLKLPSIIHVAGTNGKGSTIAQMRAQLEALGHKVHAHTSPHLFQFNERIRIAGELISDDQLLEEIDYVWALNDGAEITFFEFTTALMFHVFAKYPADYTLIEVGMGGRLDSTNVIKNPALTVITSIGYDHQQFLGDDIASIAREKAGIIKEGVPCLIAYQPHKDAYAPIKNIAKMHNAKMIAATSTFEGQVHMHGLHQQANAATANEALKILIPDFKWNDDAKPDWPGRFQKLDAPFDLYYDGAHNVDGLKALTETINTQFSDRTISFIIAMQAKKDPQIVKDTIGALDADFYLTKVEMGTDNTTAQDLATRYEQTSLLIKSHNDNMADLIDQAHQDNPKNIIFVVGSLYAAQLIPAQYWPNIKL